MASGAAGEGHVRRIGERGLPHHFAGVLVGGDDPRRIDIVAGEDDIAPECGAAIGLLAFLLRVHAPHDAADIAGSAVDLVEHAP